VADLTEGPGGEGVGGCLPPNNRVKKEEMAERKLAGGEKQNCH